MEIYKQGTKVEMYDGGTGIIVNAIIEGSMVKYTVAYIGEDYSQAVFSECELKFGKGEKAQIGFISSKLS
ncbi:MAG: hypothetical protein HOG49_29145 [Candidatus Scalindua sp.]|jgi:hypothetical protein|nr:hypothetical protein [Candidatus Scalindua sp.]